MEASMKEDTSPWQGRRVLLVGCTDFLGGAVTRELLGRGATVVGLVRERGRGAEFAREIAAGRFHLVHGDSRDAARLHSAMASHEVTAVFHLEDTEPLSAIRAAGLYHSRVPVISSRLPRQWSFASGEMRSPLVGIARFGELFGPNDRDTTRRVSRTLLALLAGETPLPTTSTVRDYVFVRDAARACVGLAEAVGRAGHALDCTFRTGWEFSDAQLVKTLVTSIAGAPPTLASSAPTNSHCWRPELSLAAALTETIEWYREFAGTIDSRHSAPTRRAA
jgi:nucleoside-diphosphate-sugar epimerase